MKSSRPCPFCAAETPVEASWCGNCGRNIPEKKASKTKHSYKIVPDGSRYGIAQEGRLLIGGLESEAARLMLQALTSRKMRWTKSIPLRLYGESNSGSAKKRK